VSEVDLNKESKKFVEAVFTIGDNGGYRLYEWFKLFPKERELVEKEYVYLKAHLARQAYKEAGKDITKEMWNALYLALGKAFETEKGRLECSYEELCKALSYYENASLVQLPVMFGQRSGIGASIYSRQFVKDLPDLISRSRADLWKKFRS